MTLAPLKKAVDFLYGLHSGIPACCCLAFVTGRATIEKTPGAHYRTCARCDREIRQGARQASRLAICAKHPPSPWCRFLKWAGNTIFSVDAPHCPFCQRRGFSFNVHAVGKDGEMELAEGVGACVWCGKAGASDGSFVLGGVTTLAQLRAVNFPTRGIGILNRHDSTLFR